MMITCVHARSCPTLFWPTPWTVAHQALCSWDFPGKNTGVGCHSLLQGVFSTQGLNPRHLHCTRLFITCHQGSPQLMMQVLKQLFGNSFLQRSYLECVHREGESFLSRELYIHDSKTKWDTARIYQDTMQASKGNQIPLVLKLVV